MPQVEHSVLVAAAWAEHDAAREEYYRTRNLVRSEGVSKRSASKRGRVIGAKHRLARAWMSLYELGEVDLDHRSRRAG